MRTRSILPLPAFDPAIACMLEEIYAECSVPGRLERDPLALVVPYLDVADREVAGLVASVLAFGSVDLILKACRIALSPLGEHPASALLSMDEGDIAEIWKDFQYRFMFSADMVALLVGIRKALRMTGSLEAYFCSSDPGGARVTATGRSTVSPDRSKVVRLLSGATHPAANGAGPSEARDAQCARRRPGEPAKQAQPTGSAMRLIVTGRPE